MVSAQWHVGCEVGANWSTVKFPSYEMGGKRMTGFNIGAVVMLAVLIIPIILFNRNQAKELEGKV
jgi:hypothetical protein